MPNDINRNNVITMIQETAHFCRDAKQIFNDLCIELGNKNLIKDNDAVYESFFFDKEGWVSFEFYFEANDAINGFRLLIAAGDTEEYGRYQQIVKQLGADRDIPLLIAYGCFKPTEPFQSSKNITSMMDVCFGFTSKDDEEFDWVNFDNEFIAWDTPVSIETKKWSKEIEHSRNYPEWKDYFSKAIIKYKPLLGLQNHSDVQNLANEIKALTF